MNNKTKLGVLIGGSVMLVILILFCMRISYNRQSVQLRNLVVADTQKVETSFDNMYRTIKDQAGISDKYADKLKELVLGTMEARYANSNKGEMWSWIQEQNPTLDPKIYTTLMQTVEAKRSEFKAQQDELIAANNELNNLIDDPIASTFLSDHTKIDITIISSEQTKDTMKSGVDRTDPINGK